MIKQVAQKSKEIRNFIGKLLASERVKTSLSEGLCPSFLPKSDRFWTLAQNVNMRLIKLSSHSSMVSQDPAFHYEVLMDEELLG
jgi:hypothetical protein